MTAPRLLLHIGYPKTGTTAIQTFLLANRGLLRKRGVLYPETGLLDSAHRLLSTTFYSAANRENRSACHMNQLLDEMASSRCPRVILSFEGFCGDNPAIFAPLRERYAITVIVYLRRQDHLAESLYAQKVRSLLTQECRPLDPAQGMDYRRMLALYAAAFGKDRMAVRVFERDQLVNRDLIDDFLHVAEIRRCPEFKPSTSSNSALKRPYLAFKRHANLLPLLDHEQKSLNQNLNQLSRTDPSPPLGRLLSPGERLRLIQSQEEANAEVAREFLGRPDGVLFKEPLPAGDDPWEPLSPLDAAGQRAVFEKLTPENRAIIEFLHRPARLALPGDPLLPDLPDDDPDAFDALVDRRTTRQIQRRLTLLEERFGAGPHPGGRP